MERTPITELELLQVNNRTRNYLIEIRKWTFFLSIVGFIGIAFLIVIGLFSSVLYGDMMNTLSQAQMPFDMSVFMTATYIILALIYFFPVLYLFKFSKRLKIALATKNDDKLADAIEMLKSHYKFIGVFMIIILSLYALLFIVGLLGIAMV